MSNRISRVCKAPNIEQTNKNVDLEDIALQINHTQIKLTNYTATRGKYTPTRLVRNIT